MKPEEAIEYREGMNYGTGYNSNAGTLHGCAIETSMPFEYGDQAQKAEFSVEIVTSQVNLYNSLSISASVDAKIMDWGGSAKGAFIESFSFENNCIYILIRSLIVNPATIMSKEDLTLNTQAIEILKQGRYDDFKRAFGNKYILGFVSGCELFSLIQIQSLSLEHKNKITAEIGAKLPIHGVDVSATGSFEATLNNVMKSSQVKVRHYQSGGKNVFITQSYSDFLKNVDQFKQEVKDGYATRYAAILANYTDFNLPKDASKEFALETSDNYSDVLIDTYRRMKYDCRNKLSILEDALLCPEKYENIDEFKEMPKHIFMLIERFDKLSKEIQKLSQKKGNKLEESQVVSMIQPISDVVIPSVKISNG